MTIIVRFYSCQKKYLICTEMIHSHRQKDYVNNSKKSIRDPERKVCSMLTLIQSIYCMINSGIKMLKYLSRKIPLQVETETYFAASVRLQTMAPLTHLTHQDINIIIQCSIKKRKNNSCTLLNNLGVDGLVRYQIIFKLYSHKNFWNHNECGLMKRI